MTATKLLAVGLIIGAYATVGAPIGAVVIPLVYVTTGGRDRPTLWRALSAAFLGLAAYGVVLAVWEVASPAFGPMVGSLLDAYKAAHGVPPPINSPPVAPTLGAFVAEQCVAFTAFVVLVSARLGGEPPGVAQWVRSAVSSGVMWSAMAALLFGVWLESPGSRTRSVYLSAAATRPIEVSPPAPRSSAVAAHDRPAPAASHAAHHLP